MTFDYRPPGFPPIPSQASLMIGFRLFRKAIDFRGASSLALLRKVVATFVYLFCIVVSESKIRISNKLTGVEDQRACLVG